MKNINPHIIAPKLEKIILNLQPYEAIKIRLLKNFTLTICKIKNSRGIFFNVIGDLTHPCDKEYCEKVIEFTAYDISFSYLFEQIVFINLYETHYTTINYDSNFIKIEDFSMNKEKRTEMFELLANFNRMVDSYRC